MNQTASIRKGLIAKPMQDVGAPATHATMRYDASPVGFQY